MTTEKYERLRKEDLAIILKNVYNSLPFDEETEILILDFLEEKLNIDISIML